MKIYTCTEKYPYNIEASVFSEVRVQNLPLTYQWQDSKQSLQRDFHVSEAKKNYKLVRKRKFLNIVLEHTFYNKQKNQSKQFCVMA